MTRKNAAYKVHIGYTAKGNDRYRYFATLADAVAFCGRVFAETRVALSIVAA